MVYAITNLFFCKLIYAMRIADAPVIPVYIIM